jgi:hypothetical protein
VREMDPREASCTPHEGVLEVTLPHLTFQPWEELRVWQP